MEVVEEKEADDEDRDGEDFRVGEVGAELDC